MLSRKIRHISEQSGLQHQQQQQQQHPFRLTAILDDSVPVVKPTVYRWKPSNDSYRRRSAPVQPTLPSIDKRGSIDTASGIRKDSGISLDADGPVKKKKRVLSAEESMQSRKLPELQHTEPFFYNPRRRPTLLEPRSPRIHPLDRRSSSSSNSPFMPPIGSPSIQSSTSQPSSVTLPAITSITAHHRHRRATAAHLYDLTSNAARVTSSALMADPCRVSMPQPPPQQQQQQQQLFVCEKIIDSGRICGQTFRRSYDLSRHQTIHLKNRPYCYCDQCGKKFTRMDALRRHERVQGHASSSSSSSGVGRSKYKSRRVPSPSASSNNNGLHRHAQQARA
ncbi:hypothetical protein BJV82DRAFT_336330 [Fennellomyces sp. T-0311]|nr:hypothetical protein BJV82DRAFT_336330 [Fennellomyces sp. T-0311]